jgi:hypothetical protein
MIVEYSSSSLITLFKPLTNSVSVKAATKAKVRLGLTLIVTLMVISSPVIMFINPISIASAAPTDPTSSTSAAPSTISQDGSEFTTQ